MFLLYCWFLFLDPFYQSAYFDWRIKTLLTLLVVAERYWSIYVAELFSYYWFLIFSFLLSCSSHEVCSFLFDILTSLSSISLRNFPNDDLVVMNLLWCSLLWKYLISPSILKENLLGCRSHGWKLSFTAWSASPKVLLASKVSVVLGFPVDLPLYVIYCLSLIVFKILSLCWTSKILTRMWHEIPFWSWIIEVS